MSGMHAIVVRLEQQGEGGAELVVTDQMAVAPTVEEATGRLGASSRDLFAVWTLPGWPDQAQAKRYVESFEPDSIWVISEGWPFQLAERYVQEVRRVRG